MQKKIVVVHQSDAKDCGPCCLKSIIEYYGGYVPLEKIRENAYTSVEGTSVYHLMSAAKKYGFDAIAKKYPDNQIANIQLPAIVHVKYSNGLLHFMVLYKMQDSKVLLMDPAKGKVWMSKDEFNNIFTGVIIELSVRSQIVKFEKESTIYQLFFNIIKANKRLCLNLLLCTALFIVTTLIFSFYFKIGYEQIQNNSYQNSFNLIIYLFLIICLLKLLSEFFKNYYENHLNKNIDVSIYQQFISHIFNLPLKVINQRTVGEFVTRINEISNIKDLFSKMFVSGILDLILSICTLILLFAINKILALVLLAVVIIYLIISIVFVPYIYRRFSVNLDYGIEFNSNLIEGLEIINSIKNLNKTPCIVNKLENKICNLIYDNYTFTNALNSITVLKKFVLEIGVFLINTLGFFLIYQSEFSVINLVIFNSLIYYCIEPIENLESIIPRYNFLRASFNKICDFLDLEEEKIGHDENFISGDIIFNKISFSYNDYYDVLKELNLNVKCGEKVVIKGSSGSGKSTICKLLHRYYEPTSGEIIINNKNIKDYSLKTIRNRILYVGQKEQLIGDTIKNNILFFNNNSIDFDRVCNICFIDQIVDKKAFRYDFGIDNQCANISGGEKQRIVLARALLRGGDILILDEALSEVDIFLERKIIRNIIKSYPQKTLIYITHKNLDKEFDRVISMREIGG